MRQNTHNVFSKTMIDFKEDNDKGFYTFFNGIRSDI